MSSRENAGTGGRVRLSRAEQRYNYGLAIAAVAAVVVLTIISQQLILALLVAAFLFGLGQMLVGITRRRRFLREQARGFAGGEAGITSPSPDQERKEY